MSIQKKTELSLSIVSGSSLAGRDGLLQLLGHKEALCLDDVSEDFKRVFRDRVIETIERRVSLTLSVGLTHPWVIYAMEAARAKGYRVELHHVGTSDAAQELASAGRRLTSESRQCVEQRWERRASLLPCAVARSDISTVYALQASNVVEQARFELAQRVDDGAVEPWVESQVLMPLRSRKADLADLQNKVTNNGWSLAWADLLSGIPHAGLLGPAYDSLVVQYAARGTVLVHDRAVLGPQSPHQLDPGHSLVVDYAQWPSGAYGPQVVDRLPPIRKKTKAKKLG